LIGNLALEAETAVPRLPVLNCEYYSKELAECTETLHSSHKPHSKRITHSEYWNQ